MTSKKPEWFELIEGGESFVGIQRIDKKLPIATLLIAGSVILGGSLFATANNEPSALASGPTTTQSIVTTVVTPRTPTMQKLILQNPTTTLSRQSTQNHEDIND